MSPRHHHKHRPLHPFADVRVRSHLEGETTRESRAMARLRNSVFRGDHPDKEGTNTENSRAKLWGNDWR
ncbi:uncharacterized protein LOC112460518 isoform X2 [Temnothorax curvispinosus]|uniref:Uncharacterized protein LOC112460518 isoform X2 n=1 Tax=Temnothorax curvispinosus TaxID=300111 RepID=A0A6J1QIJ5_9HYME|nr:uncharacterized protein LOC112460518 isoform X2 [Temnothorax curvispinosus]